MSRRTGALPPAQTDEQMGASARVIPLAVCEESTEKLCVLSTGYDAEGNLLISLKTALQPMPAVYGVLRSQKVEIRFDCQMVDIAPRLLYCLGPFSGDAASVTLEIYTVEGDSLLASGLLAPGEMAQVPEPPAVELPPELAIPAPTETPYSYPDDTTPSYPSYPAYP